MEIEELINRGKKGDENALCHLYNTYSHKMVRICVKIVGNRMIAEELTHDAFILAFSKLNQLQNPKRFEKWLSTIVSNISFRYLEQNEKYNTISLSDLNEKETPHNYDSHTFESEQKTPLDIKDILLAIEQLPKGYQSVFKMSVLQGMSHNEIADILGIAARSSASQLARAKRLLRQHLSKYLVALLVIITAPIIYFISKQRNTNNAIHSIVSKNNEPAKESAQLPDSSSIVTPPSVTKTPQITKRVQAKHKYIAPESVPVSDSTIYTPIDSTSFIAKRESSIDTIAIDSIKPNHTPNEYITINDSTDLDFSIPSSESDTPEWNLNLAYSNNIKSFYPHSNVKVLANDGAFPDGIIHIKDFNELETWQEAIDYANYANIPKAEKDAITRIANKYISQGLRTISRSQNHHFPFTASVSISRRISQRFDIESGLSYSKLSSELITGKENAGLICYQDIHYLGIPLKLSFNWIETSHWGIYSSAGIMMDIPIQAKQETDYILYKSNLYHKSQHIDAPLQWSVGLGIGLQYKITPNIGLFTEPNIYYYIPNGSDIETYRTKHPISISLPIGIRVNW